MPQIRKSGSTGVKADIDIGSAKYRAIGQVAGQIGDGIKDFNDRSQRLRDNGLAADYTATSIGFESEMNKENSAFNIEQDPEKRKQILKQELDRRSEYVNKIAAKMSPGARAALVNNSKIDNAKLSAKYESQIVTDGINNSNASILSAANKLVMANDPEGAYEQIELMEISDAQKTIHSDKIQSVHWNNQRESIETAIGLSESTEEVDEASVILKDSDLPVVQKERTAQIAASKRRSLLSAEETYIVSESISAISEAATGNDVESVVINSLSTGDSISKGAMLRIDNAINKRMRSIESSDATQLATDLSTFSDAMGALADEDMEMAIVASDYIKDTELRGMLVSAIMSNTGTLGPDDPEVVDLVGELEYFTGKIWKDATSAKQRKRTEAILSSPEYSMKAKMTIAIAAMDAASNDATDDHLESWLSLNEENSTMEWRDGVMEIDDSQALAIKLMSQRVSSSTKIALEENDWTKSLISPAGVLRMYRIMHREDTLDEFKELSTEDATEKWKSIFIGTPDKPGPWQREINSGLYRRYQQRARMAGKRVK